MCAADEQQLVHMVQDGNHDAFRLLVERYMKQAYNVAYGFVSDHDDAEDVAQESFVRAYQSIGTFRGESGFGTWLYRIVTNIALNRVRQKKTAERRNVAADDDTLVLAGDGGVGNGDPEVRNAIERVLHELPTLQRAVVILRHLNGLSTRQVSTILSCSEGTVKVHLHRGLKKMRTKMSFLKDEGR